MNSKVAVACLLQLWGSLARAIEFALFVILTQFQHLFVSQLTEGLVGFVNNLFAVYSARAVWTALRR